MASLYITEFASFGGSDLGHQQVAAMPPVAEQKLTIGSEVDSAALNAQTKFVRLHCDAICSIKIGASVNAAVTNMRLPADTIEYFGVQPGQFISVIANT